MRHAQTARDATHFYMKKENTVLNNLIETLKDGQEGFKQAAESISDPTDRSVNDSSASVKNKVAVNRAAVSKADDKAGCSLGTNERREVTPAAFLFTSKCLSKGETILLCQKKK